MLNKMLLNNRSVSFSLSNLRTRHKSTKLGGKGKRAKSDQSEADLIVHAVKANFGPIDTNLENLQLSIALSRSTSGENQSVAADVAHPSTQQKIAHVRTTLEQFGFHSKQKLTPNNNKCVVKRRKNSKFKHITPALLSRKAEERSRIIADKVAALLRDNWDESSRIAPTAAEQLIELNSDYLRSLLCMERRCYSFSHLSHCAFYTRTLNLSPNRSRCGSLLKDWAKIPGRELSPIHCTRDAISPDLFSSFDEDSFKIREQHEQPALTDDAIQPLDQCTIEHNMEIIEIFDDCDVGEQSPSNLSISSSFTDEIGRNFSNEGSSAAYSSPKETINVSGKRFKSYKSEPIAENERPNHANESPQFNVTDKSASNNEIFVISDDSLDADAFQTPTKPVKRFRNYKSEPITSMNGSESTNASSLIDEELNYSCLLETMATPQPSTIIKQAVMDQFKCEVEIKSRAVSPQVDYNAMDTPTLGRELQKHGVKPLKRKRGVQLLQYIYETTHPIVPIRASGSSECRPLLEIKSQLKTDHQISIVGNELIENVGDQCYIFEKTQSRKIASCRVPLEIVWHNFVAANPEIRENILLYEPIELEVIHAMLKQQVKRNAIAIVNKMETDNNEDEDAQIEEIAIPDEEDVGAASEMLLTDAEIEDLFNKDTESFLCLRQVLLSRSSLLRHPLYFFPPIEDPGLDEAFNYEEPLPVYDNTGIEKYIDMCKYFNIVPLSRITQHLASNYLDLSFYSLTVKQFRSLAEALKINVYVEDVNLQDNFIPAEAATELAEMLIQNKVIKRLNLKHCRLRADGAEAISEGIAFNDCIEDLDLSFNKLEDDGFANIQPALLDNVAIVKLNLSHNRLTEDAVPLLAKLVQTNGLIEDLDISWNHFNTGPGNKILFAAFVKNESIKNLNLAWNGIVEKVALKPISTYMKKTQVLCKIDLSNNGMTTTLAGMVRVAMAKCVNLESANLAGNLFTADNVMAFAKLLLNPAKNLNYIDLYHIYVNKDFIPIQKKIEAMGRSIRVEGILCNYRILGPDTKKLLFARAQFLAQSPKKKKQKKDFGHFILSMPEQDATKQEFQLLAKKFKAKKVDLDLLTAIGAAFPAKKQKLDLVRMRDSYMTYYPDACLPPPKPKKGKKGKGKKGGKPPPEPPAVAQEPGTAEVAQEGAAQEGAAQEGAAQETPAQDPSVQDPSAQEASAQEASAQEGSAQETVPQDARTSTSAAPPEEAAASTEPPPNPEAAPNEGDITEESRKSKQRSTVKFEQN